MTLQYAVLVFSLSRYGANALLIVLSSRAEPSTEGMQVLLNHRQLRLRRKA